MAFRRRMAGAELAAHELTDVGQQLNEARGALRRAMVTANPEIMGTGVIPYDRNFEAPSFNENIEVNGHRIGLNARPGRVNLNAIDEMGPMERPLMGDKTTYDLLAANPPTVEYNLVFDVDGRTGDGQMSGRDALAVGRATTKKWNEIIAKMPENALVTNSPVGAGGGDFKRADAYMANGFGPVQIDGSQYGIVKGGKIIPLSPLAAQEDHARHLAGRARKAGEIKLGDDVLAALSDPARAKLIEYNPSGPQLAGNKSGFYDSRYDDYDGYDEDFIPPVTPQELRENAIRFKQDVRERSEYGRAGRGIPEIGIREDASGEINYRELDTHANGEISAQDIADMRSAQIAMLSQPGEGRQLMDQINEVFPRPLPQRITTDDINTNRGWRGRDRGFGGFGGGLDSMPALERRRRAQEQVRDDLDSLALNGRQGRNLDGEGVRDDIKDSSLQIDRGLPSGTAFAQEIYGPEDVETLREIQRVLAQNGMKADELSYRRRTPAARRSTYRDNPNLVRPNEPVNFLQRANPQQEADMELANDLNNRHAREREVLGLVDERFAPDLLDGRPRHFHNVYGATTVDELLANNPVSPRMEQLTNGEALRIVAQSVEQPGLTDSQEFADALRVVQGFANDVGGGEQMYNRVFNELLREPAGQRVDSNFGTISPVDMRNPDYQETVLDRPRRRASRNPHASRPADPWNEQMSMEELMSDGRTPNRYEGPGTVRPQPIDSPIVNNPAFQDLVDSEWEGRTRRRRSGATNSQAVQRGSQIPPIPRQRPDNHRREEARQQRRMRAVEARRQPSSLVTPALDLGRTRDYTTEGELLPALRQQEAMVQQARAGQSPAQEPRVINFSDAPAGMGLDEFLEWRSAQGGVSSVYADGGLATPQPSPDTMAAQRRRRTPAPSSWDRAPLVPDTDDIPF